MSLQQSDGKKDWTQIAYQRVVGEEPKELLLSCNHSASGAGESSINASSDAATRQEFPADAEEISDLALCAMSSSAPVAEDCASSSTKDSSGLMETKCKKAKTCCARQLQLPMFLSKTYHMIDKSDPEIATWAEDGQSFVVKNAELFATKVLPLYFKHSNFSSFARQLNFYGFRKLRSDPILNSNLDPQTANFVRFYHEHFQRDKPDLLQQIKRATKTDQQSKDDVEALKQEVCRLREDLACAISCFEGKLAEVSRECDQKVSEIKAHYERMLKAENLPITPVDAVSSRFTLQSQAPDPLHSLSQAASALQPAPAGGRGKRKAENREDDRY